MKIQIKNLEPNPYRDMNNYPMDEAKVKSLIESIQQTGFWDNILSRRHGNKFQIAYGHHRLAAIREVFKPTDEVDIPVKELDDATMIQIMANENMEQWQSSPGVVLETVKAVRDFLNIELSKYETWDHVNKTINMLFESNSQFQNCKKNGVGQTTILKFLGNGWKQWMIQDSLKVLGQIADKTINEEAVRELPSVRHMKEFSASVAKNPISKEKQQKIVDEIKKDETPSREVDGLFIREKYTTPKKKQEYQSEKIIKYESYVAGIRNKADDLFEDLKQLVRTEKELGEMSENIYRKLLEMSLNTLSKQIELIIKKQENEKSKFTKSDPASIAR
jgi:hypothetical protein